MTYHVSFPGLGFEVTVDRVAFTVFGMPIYWYGVLIALGLLLGMLYAFRNAKSYGIDADRIISLTFIIGSSLTMWPPRRLNTRACGRCSTSARAASPFTAR